MILVEIDAPSSGTTSWKIARLELSIESSISFEVRIEWWHDVQKWLKEQKCKVKCMQVILGVPKEDIK